MSQAISDIYDDDDMDILHIQMLFETLTIQEKKPRQIQNTKPIVLSSKMKDFFENLIERLILRQHITLYPPKLERENPGDPKYCRCKYCNKHSFLELIGPIRYGGVTEKMINDAIKHRLKRCIHYVKPLSISPNVKKLLDDFCSKHLREYYYHNHTNIKSEKVENKENTSDSENNRITFTPIQSDSDEYEESDFEFLDSMC